MLFSPGRITGLWYLLETNQQGQSFKSYTFTGDLSE